MHDWKERGSFRGSPFQHVARRLACFLLVASGLSTLPMVAEPSPEAALAAFYRQHEEVRHRVGACNRKVMDCSCFIRELFAEKFDLDLPRSTVEQAWSLRHLAVRELDSSRRLTQDRLCVGDLIYTYQGPSWEAGSRHVAVYAGQGQVLHSAASLKGVGMSSLTWLRQFSLHGVYRPLGC